MSRTKRNKRDPSFEYWSRRPFNRCGGTPNKFHKKRTHKAERQEANRVLQDRVE